MEADARVASALSGSAVATWICQTQLAGQVAEECLRGAIHPVAERGVLLPVAASCAAFYGLIEPGWLKMVEGERVKAQRSTTTNPFLRPLLMLPALDSLGEVLLPAMREEVDRNTDALEGRSIADLPDLIQQIPAVAEVGRLPTLPEPRPGAWRSNWSETGGASDLPSHPDSRWNGTAEAFARI